LTGVSVLFGSAPVLMSWSIALLKIFSLRCYDDVEGAPISGRDSGLQIYSHRKSRPGSVGSPSTSGFCVMPAASMVEIGVSCGDPVLVLSLPSLEGGWAGGVDRGKVNHGVDSTVDAQRAKELASVSSTARRTIEIPKPRCFLCSAWRAPPFSDIATSGKVHVDGRVVIPYTEPECSDAGNGGLINSFKAALARRDRIGDGEVVGIVAIAWDPRIVRGATRISVTLCPDYGVVPTQVDQYTEGRNGRRQQSSHETLQPEYTKMIKQSLRHLVVTEGCTISVPRCARGVECSSAAGKDHRRRRFVSVCVTSVQCPTRKVAMVGQGGIALEMVARGYISVIGSDTVIMVNRVDPAHQSGGGRTVGTPGTHKDGPPLRVGLPLNVSESKGSPAEDPSSMSAKESLLELMLLPAMEYSARPGHQHRSTGSSSSLGSLLPSGVLLTGPPGVGKTFSVRKAVEQMCSIPVPLDRGGGTFE
ncbi:unnamed protein product, partial [Discosporangium mesarthrocarpum]